MNTISEKLPMPAFPAPGQIAAKAIVYAWLAAGAFDILASFIINTLKGGSSLGVLRAIASGILGTRVIGSGLDVAMFGLALHFGIMLVIVLVYWLASRRLPFLIDRAAIFGPVYGVMVFTFMSFVVLPLSAIAFKPDYSWPSLATGIVVHMLCVGLPIALILRSVSRRVAP